MGTAAGFAAVLEVLIVLDFLGTGARRLFPRGLDPARRSIVLAFVAWLVHVLRPAARPLSVG